MPSATGSSMRSFSRCCISVPSLAVASTPTASTWPAVFVPAAVTGSPGPSVAAWPLARVGVGCAISSTAVPDAESTMTTVACCSLPSGMTAVTWVIPATIWADVTSCPSVTAAAVPLRFELPDGITSWTTPGTAEGGTVEATVTTGAVVAAVTRTTVVATSSVAGWARWATYAASTAPAAPMATARASATRPPPGAVSRAGRADGQWLDRPAQLGRVAPPPLLGRQVGVGTWFVPVVPVARLHGGAHY